MPKMRHNPAGKCTGKSPLETIPHSKIVLHTSTACSFFVDTTRIFFSKPKKYTAGSAPPQTLTAIYTLSLLL